MSTLELAILIVAFSVAVLAIRPYVNARLIYAINVLLCFYWIVDILEAGPDAESVALLALSAAFAFEAWWKRLRGKPPPEEP